MTLSSNSRLGTGRYVSSHWIHSHPAITPCDTFPLCETQLLSEPFHPKMAMAPRFPFGAYWATPSTANTQAKLPKEPWLLYKGREVRYSSSLFRFRRSSLLTPLSAARVAGALRRPPFEG